MKKSIYTIAIAAVLMGSTGCSDWLNLQPNNEQVSDDYWQSKEDVEAVVASGYYYMRKAVPSMLMWGEVRGATLYSSDSKYAKIQNFDVESTNEYCKYSVFYQAINMANSVLKYAPSVRTVDDTYYESVLNAHLCEAYFMRAYCYLILMKNYKEVPLVVEPYVNDDADFIKEKATEEQIIAQIKADVIAALATGAAKSNYEETWETKGRATKWVLYALMADVCLWNHDYDECIQYCNDILEATDAMRPAFITNTASWYEIFYPGNSNESIFELNWDKATYNETNNFTGYLPVGAFGFLNVNATTRDKMEAETATLVEKGADITGRVGRMLMTSYVCGSTATDYNSYATAQYYYIWKYRGTDVVDVANVRTYNDANFILYRVAEIMMFKAEALIMKGQESWPAAVKLINALRNRAGLDSFVDESSETFAEEIATMSEEALLTEVLDQREMEFLAEGKRWYDVLRLARYDNGTNNYKQSAIDMICMANRTINELWIRTVLDNDYAWYLPLPESEITSNSLLVQNPYYTTNK